MEREWEIYWSLYEDHYSNEYLLQNLEDPFKRIGLEIANNDLLDIGCGQSSLILSYSRNGGHITAIDKEPTQLAALERRLAKLDSDASRSIDFIPGLFPTVQPIHVRHGLCVMSDILHFMDRREIQRAILAARDFLVPGAIVFAKVHSEKHFAARINQRYFESFLSRPELEAQFKDGGFQCIETWEDEEPRTDHDVRLIEAWVGQVAKEKGKTQEEADAIVDRYLKQGPAISCFGLFLLKQPHADARL